MRELGLTELNNASSLPPLYLAVFSLPTRACMILTCAHARVYEHTHTRIPPVLSAPLAFLPLFARQFRTHTPRPALYYTTTAPTLYTTIFYDFVKSMKNVDGFPPSLDSCSSSSSSCSSSICRRYGRREERASFFPSILILSCWIENIYFF